MLSFLARLFDTSDFAVLSDAGDWSGALGWLHIASSLALFAAYLLIPAVLLAIALRKNDVPASRLGWPLALFFLVCGVVHLLDAAMFWWPAYRLSGTAKAVAAVVSWGVILWSLPALPNSLRRTRNLSDHGAVSSRERALKEDSRSLYELGDQLATEIREREAAIATAQANEQMFRNTFLRVGVGLAHVSREGRWIRVNPALCQITGYSAQELMQKTFQDITHPDDLDADLELAAKVWSGEIPEYSMEKRYLCKDGAETWVLLTVSLARDRSGAPEYFISCIQRYDEFRRTQLALDASRDRLRLALDASGAGMWAFDLAGDWGYWDENFERLHGLEPGAREMTYANFLNLVHPEDRSNVDVEVRRVYEARTRADLRYRVIWPDGRTRILEARGEASRHHEGESWRFLGMCWDVTEQQDNVDQIRILNRDLAVQARSLRAANEELESIAYSVSHDLRAPLRSIEGFSTIIIEDYADRLDEDGIDYLNRIRNATTHMSQLIDDVLELSKLSRTTLRRTTVDLTEMATDIVRQLSMEDTSQILELRIAPGLKAFADAVMCRTLLENLLGNAWKFTRNNGVVRIEVDAQSGHEGTIFSVRDNGVGFDMRYAGRLFTPFQRLHRSDEFEGTGVGLASAKRVVAIHGGKIWAEGEIGRGATFYFTLGQGGEGYGGNKFQESIAGRG